MGAFEHADLGRAPAFAFLADVAMLVLGGDLKRREMLSARFGDVLSQMYLASAVLKRYADEGRQQADAPLMHWAAQDAIYRARAAFDGILANFPGKVLSALLRVKLFPWGVRVREPDDELNRAVARLMIAPSATRDRLLADSYVPKTDAEPVGAIEQALEATIDAEPIETKIREAEKRGLFANNPQANVRDLAVAAREAGVVTSDEYAVLERRNRLRDIVIRVDDFPFDLGVASAQKRDAERLVA